MNIEVRNKIEKSLKKRHFFERLFKNIGAFSIVISMAFLIILFAAIISRGYSAFIIHKINLGVTLEKDLDGEINYRKAVKDALKAQFPEAESIHDKTKLHGLISKIATVELKKTLLKNPDLIGKKQNVWLTASSNVDMYLKGKISENTPGEIRNLKDNQIAWIKILQKNNQIKSEFNWLFFKQADSRESEIAGMSASIVGSILTIIIFLLCAFPIAIMSAFYLEEFAPKNIVTDIIEISINNLAAVPSIIYGLLGLVVYLNFLHMPRSSSIVAGCTLFLLVLPIIIIATRNSIKSIPSSIKDAATALGASKTQVMLHHTLPLSMPGIMTGTILAVSRALGETAPLLMIGMVAFIADTPTSFTDPTTVMPVQIYLWSDSPELGFAEKTAGAIMVLLGFLITFNGFAVYLRKKFERKW